MTYVTHLLQMLEESIKVSLIADRVEYSIFAHASAIDERPTYCSSCFPVTHGRQNCFQMEDITSSFILITVESRSALDQNTSWVIVEIPPEKILLEQIV